jgi:glycosyltransferase involved in cell wall biosynthesis
LTSVPVTFVSSHAKAGGAELYLMTLVDSLGPSWVREVVALEDGPLVEQLRARRIPTEVLGTSARMPGIVRSAWKLRRRLSGGERHVVHANGIKAALVATLATVRTGTPVVWVKHDFSYDGRLARFVAGRSREVIGVSAAVTDTFKGDVRRKVRVVHNGIAQATFDRELARSRLLEALGPPAPSAVVALVARLDPVKGHRELLAGAPGLAEAVPGVRIAFVGGTSPPHPAYPDELRREVAVAGLEEVVAFLGHRDDAEELIAGADLVAIPTVVDARGMGREGFPYVGLEALAAGTPIVGYAHGGLPELVGDCGTLVPAGDRDALRAASVELLRDDARRERLARCGQERADREFSLPRMVESMKERYLAAAEAGP